MFSLSKYDDTNGLEVQIIKDWKEMLTQVGDHQSLLQSLKDSPYFKGTEQCVIIILIFNIRLLNHIIFNAFEDYAHKLKPDESYDIIM